MSVRLISIAVMAAWLLTPSIHAQTEWPTRDWNEAEPQEVGLNARILASIDADIRSGKYGYVDSMLIIRHGKIAFERAYKHDYDDIYETEARTRSPLNAHDPSGPYNYFNPWWHPYYQRGDLHTMQSVTKSVTSAVIGVAVGRGEFPNLDTPVLQFFDESTVANIDDRKRRMTIRHLLTMTAGLQWNESVPPVDPTNDCSLMEASFDWVRFVIDKPMAHEPGTTFNYNSGASQILSHIFRRHTGRDVEEYGRQYLFRILGIERHYWKRTPTGLPDTEGGLYLRSRDLAKIAYLYMKGGMWDGNVVIPSSWVESSLAPQVTLEGRPRYGFKWWLYPYGTGRVAWGGLGFGGQRPIVLPEYDLLVVFTGWNILPKQPNLAPSEAIRRVAEAVTQ